MASADRASPDTKVNVYLVDSNPFYEAFSAVKKAVVGKDAFELQKQVKELKKQKQELINAEQQAVSAIHAETQALEAKIYKITHPRAPV